MDQPIRIRIRFITLLAVFVIVTAGGGILLWGAQNVLFHFVLDADQLPFTRPEVAAKLPRSIGFLLGHLHLFLGAMLGLSVTEDTATYAFALGSGVSVLLSLLCLWLIGWLMSARVKAEFGVYR